MVDIIFGWDATSDNIEDWMYEDITRKFVLDGETRDWIMRVNKWAMHAMTERLLEAESRGMWDAPEAMLAELKELYLETEGGIEECL
jgi:cobaltochelatase CobN